VADNTSIEWADCTWNPLLGCERVSSGCDRCYAINTATIRAGNPHPKVAAAFAGLTERRDGRLDWTGRINLLPDRLGQPLTWRKPRKVFVNSQSDLFHKDVPEEFIAQVFAIMAIAKQHTFQVLTKRHARMRSLLNRPEFRTEVQRAALQRVGDRAPWLVEPWWPLPNVHLGVSVEDQKWANVRIPALLDTPAAVRWLSCEPLLGPIDLTEVAPGTVYANRGFNSLAGDPRIGWVVCGGESGPGARPMHPDWARSLRDQCVAAGVPYLFKQWGDWHPTGDGEWFLDQRCQVIDPSGKILGRPWCEVERLATAERAGCAVVSRVGKKAAGRELDGRTWDEYPAERAAVAR
jgi:protein gp37